MNRLLSLVATFVVIPLLFNCSQPLESSSDDATVIIDTVEIVDTILVVDTVLIVDTVIVVISDSTGADVFCGSLPSCCSDEDDDQGRARKQIAWFLNNQEGLFNLEFVAIIESDDPPQALVVDISGIVFEWLPVESMEFTTNMNLKRNATVTISSTAPHAYGHVIDICLNVTPN